jgi:hypothetical protein
MTLTKEQSAILDHAGYEWWMFRATFDILSALEPDLPTHQGDPVRNALLESLIVHGRGLAYFFYGKKKEVKDWHVSDLGVQAEKWPPPSALDQWREDANWRVAHLTEDRGNQLASWDAVAVRAILQARVDALRTAIAADMPKDWWGDRATQTSLLVLPQPGGLTGALQGPMNAASPPFGGTGAATVAFGATGMAAPAKPDPSKP